MSSDRAPSAASVSLLSPPPIRPDPAYIAASAASQIVSSDRAEQGDESFDGTNENDTPVVSPGSLILVNAFLDHLLFSFLARARSTSITSLRPVILEVLKPRLGREAIDGADEELEGYLAGGDAEELLAFHSGQEFRGEYNLNLIWRRTRLRCMVYTRLGDMEEEDEEMYLEEEQEEDANDGRPRLTRDLGSVSPAAAIFLTSIIEFIGEHALLVASEAAFNRSQTKQYRAEESRHLVEEVDMEKIAFNPTLGRLWRAWKKRVRTSTLLSPRPMSREMRHRTSSNHTSRNASTNEENESSYFGNTASRPSMGEVLKKDRNIAKVPQDQEGDLPEEPDFDESSAVETNDAPTQKVNKTMRDRPRSMIEYPRPRPESPMLTPTQSSASNQLSPPEAGEQRPVQKRQRPSSVPVRQSPYVSPTDETFTTPTESPDPFTRDGDRADVENTLPKLTNDERPVPELASGDQAVATMYDGAINKSDEELPETLPKGMAERTHRGISTYTDTSNQTNEFDQEIAPEALDVERPIDAASTANSGSRESTVSSNYEFQGGEMDAAAHVGVLGQSAAEDLNGPEEEEASNNDADNSQQLVGNFADLTTISGHLLRTYDDNGKAGKRDIPVLYEAPFNEDVIYNPEASIRTSTGLEDEGELPTPTMHGQITRDSQGVPPLTPPQELMEAAGETSDEASSTAHSNHASRSDVFVPKHRPQGSGGPRTASYSSSTYNHAQPSTAANKFVDLQAQPVVVNAGTERAAAQRMPPTPTGTTTAGRTSTSSNRDGRPITASSNTSQLSSKIKGMLGRESGDLNRQPLPNRASTGDSGSLINGSLRQPRSADKESDFEELIRSDETVKISLTSQNMREIESPDSPRYQGQSQTAELAGFIRTSGPNSLDTERSTAGRATKLKGLNGLRSNPTNGTSPTAMTHGPTSSIDSAKAQAKGRVLRPRSPGGVAREPTTKNDSVRDFADFIRSTGPDTGAEPVPRSVSTPIAKRSPSGSISSPQVAGQGKPIPKKITKQVHVAGKEPGAEPPRRTTSKLQPREPTVTNSNATADLAEFFRSGPAGGQVDGPRAEAGMQARTRANGVANGRLRDAVNSGSSVASTQDSFAPSKMTQSSANSRTGLLDSSNRSAPAQRGGRNDDSLGPTRTQRRLKDPYAIDSDYEETDEYVTPQPSEREEETLADFLRNYNPPSTSTNARGAPVTLTGAPKPAKQSGPTIRERIARNIAVIPDYRPLPPKTPKKPSSSKSPPQSNESSGQRKSSNTGYQPQTQSNVARDRSVGNAAAAPQTPPINPRAVSPHLITQNGTKMDTYKPTQPTYAKHADRRPKQHLQAREEQGSVGGMGDLADFLRETEPPPPSGPIARPMSPTTKEKEESAFGKIFSRRKKEVR